MEQYVEDAGVCTKDVEILMLKRLSEKFAEKLVRAGIVSETDADVYVYGFFQLAMLLLNIITTILLGILFQSLLLCLLLNAAYIPIRLSAGGHHADSPLRCYVNSTLMIAILLAVIRWIPIHPLVSILLLGTAGGVIWWLAPVETSNRPLDEAEWRVYRKRTRIVLLVETAASLLALLFWTEQAAATIALGLFTEALMLLVGTAKNRRQNRDI